MPNVAEIIREHVTLDVKCVDRLYLNGYVPRLQSDGGGGRLLAPGRGRGRSLAGDLWRDHDGLPGTPAGLV
jgi:hypothetical protein